MDTCTKSNGCDHENCEHENTVIEARKGSVARVCKDCGAIIKRLDEEVIEKVLRPDVIEKVVHPDVLEK